MTQQIFDRWDRKIDKTTIHSYDHKPGNVPMMPALVHSLRKKADGESYAPFFDTEAWRAYNKGAIEMTLGGASLGEDTQINRVGAQMAAATVFEDNAVNLSPVTGRPAQPITADLNAVIMSVLHVFRNESTPEAKRAAVMEQMHFLDANLQGLFDRYFESGDLVEKASVGFIDKEEKQALINSLTSWKGLKDKLRTAYCGFEGAETSDEFEAAWKFWESTLDKWIAAFDLMAAPETAQAIGTEGVEAFLKAYGLSNSPAELIALAHSDIDQINKAITAWEARCEGVDRPDKNVETNEDVLEMARGVQTQWNALFGGELDVAMSTFDEINLGTPTGFAQPERGIVLMPRTSPNNDPEETDFLEAHWEKRGAGTPGVAAHELTHMWQYGQKGIGVDYSTPLGRETGAVAAEYVFAKHHNNPHVQLEALKEARKFAQLAIAALRFHAQGSELNEEVQGLLDVDLDETYVKKLMFQLKANPSVVMYYWLGQRLLGQNATNNGESFEEALRRHAEETGLLLAGHASDPSFDPRVGYQITDKTHPLVGMLQG